jgi:hypothetical protein
MIKAASTSETLVNFYQTAWRNNPEDSHLDKHLFTMKTDVVTTKGVSYSNFNTHFSKCVILHFCVPH